MRTRNIGVRPVLRVVPFAIAAAAILAVAGCGGGSNSNPPSFRSAVITTTPAPMTYVGGNASVSVNVVDPAGITPSTVKVDVTDAAGASLLGGPQVMNPIANATSTYSYAFTVPNNLFGTSSKVYSVSATATDTNGNKPFAPVVLGTVTVPFPPPPPGGP